MISTFNKIAELLSDTRQPRLEGWATQEKGYALAATAFALRPRVAVEIGVWAGRSLFPVALALQEIGAGRILAIDPWQSQASVEGYSSENKIWWETVANHDHAFNQFNETSKALYLQHFIEIHRQRSDDAKVPPVIDLLHIDGQHTEQARKDVARFGSKVRVGGIVFMDDLSWKNEGRAEVADAAADLMKLGFAFLYAMNGQGNDFAVFQRIK
jgi:predicted O-methyltransferase YrrM